MNEGKRLGVLNSPLLRTTNIALFHQNDAFATQGGIERYVSTLFEADPRRVFLVSPAAAPVSSRHFVVDEAALRHGPQWMRFLAGVFLQRREISAFLREHGVGVVEFSRPEYVLAAWLFACRRVVTIHGTGPGPGHWLHRIVHDACCLLLPLVADRVQIVGRDPSGVPSIVLRALGPRVAYVDAWCDDSFTVAPLPPLANGDRVRVFYAGRIAPQKNPKLLFEIIRQAKRQAAASFEFHYFGSDYQAFVQAGLGSLVQDHGFLSPQALADAIRSCHLGIMCSSFGEGSPYILIETLACGRPFVVPTLPTLVSAYRGFVGVHFVESDRAADYVAAIRAVRDAILAGRIDPAAISAQTAPRSKSCAATALIDVLARIDGCPPSE